MVIYVMPSPIQAWGVEFDVLKRSVEMIGKRVHRIVCLEKGIKDYLTTRSEFPVQSYAQGVDWPIEKMGTPFFPPGVKEAGREIGYDLVVQRKTRKV